MKRVLCLFLMVCMLVCLCGCSRGLAGAYFLYLVATGDDSAEKEEVFAFVRENEEGLLEAIEDGDFSTYVEQGPVTGVTTNDDLVEFSCGGAGVGSGTSYVGFYYTPDHDMTALWCAPASAEALVPCGDGFEWQEPNGDNHYYTQHICGNFYYYEASF